MKKFFSFVKCFVLFIVVAAVCTFSFLNCFFLIDEGLDTLLFLRPEGTPLEGVYLNYMLAASAGMSITIGLIALILFIVLLVIGFRKSIFFCKSSAQADDDKK